VVLEVSGIDTFLLDFAWCKRFTHPLKSFIPRCGNGRCGLVLHCIVLARSKGGGRMAF
jgi:hypothetical protein